MRNKTATIWICAGLGLIACILAVFVLAAKQRARQKEARLGQLQCAIFLRDAEGIGRLIKEGADVNAVAPNGETILLYATRHEDPDILELLIDNGADVNGAGEHGLTPLHQAVIGSVEVVRMLLKKGADPSVRSDSGHTPLHVAIIHGTEESAEILAMKDAELDVFLMAGLGRTSELEDLLSHSPDLVDARDGFGLSPLHYAVAAGRTELIPLLVRAGADVEARGSRRGCTPLFYASGHPTALRALLDAGADPNAKATRGHTALHSAAEMGFRDAAEILLEYGARTDLPDSEGRTPIDLAEDPEVVELLLAHGANPKQENRRE